MFEEILKQQALALDGLMAMQPMQSRSHSDLMDEAREVLQLAVQQAIAATVPLPQSIHVKTTIE